MRSKLGHLLLLAIFMTAFAACSSSGSGASKDSGTASTGSGGSKSATSQPPAQDMGGQIVFGRWDPAVGDQVIYAVDPDGSNLRQISSKAAEVPRLSPDGTRISSVGPDIFKLDGTVATHLPQLPGFSPHTIVGCSAWSPDGARLACEVLDFKQPAANGLYTRRASDGGGLVRVTTNPGAEDDPGDYSPDGRMLSFVRYDGARADDASTAVFVVGIDGRGLRRISAWGPFHDLTSSWSPDGNWILYDQNDQIFKVHPDGGGRQPIDIAGQSGTSGLYPGWSPDGEWIVFSMSAPDTYGLNVYTMRSDGSDVRQVTTALPGSEEHGEGDEFPDWGPSPS